MTRVSLFKAASVAALAAAALCALDGLSGAAVAVGVDGGGESPAAPAPEAAAGPAGNPDAGGLLNRRRFKRWKRADAVGGTDGGMVVHDAGVSRDGGQDGPRIARIIPRVVTPPVIAAPPPPPPVPAAPSAPSTSQPVTDLGFNTCQKIPAGKRVVKVTLKPEVELPELVAWISSVTCKSFVLPGHLSAGGKKVTFVSQGMMTRDEAYSTFLSALDSLGLTVERNHGFYKIIESSKAKTSAVPVYGFDGRPARAKSSSGD